MMKKFNRFLGIVLASAFALTSCIPAFAYTDNDSLSQVQETVISCTASEFESLLKENVCVRLDDEELLLGTPVVTTQLAESPTARASSGEQSYVSTVAIDIEFVETTDAQGDVLTTPRASYTKEEYVQSSSDVRVYAKIYWSTGEMYNAGAYVPYVKLTQVSSRYELLDTTCTLSNKCLRFGYGGYNLDTSGFVNYTSNWLNTTSYNVSAPPLEATPEGISFELWGAAKCTMTRGNQTWNVSVECFFNSND